MEISSVKQKTKSKKILRARPKPEDPTAQEIQARKDYVKMHREVYDASKLKPQRDIEQCLLEIVRQKHPKLYQEFVSKIAYSIWQKSNGSFNDKENWAEAERRIDHYIINGKPKKEQPRHYSKTR